MIPPSRPTRSELYNRLRQRRNPDGVDLFEKFAALQEDDSVKYLSAAMEEIPERYTKITKDEAERVQNQIEKGLQRNQLGAEYRLQGSVVKNTHIRGYSDIDLLVIEKRFYSLELPQQPLIPYFGDPVTDLLQIRSICATTLRDEFPKANVDTSKPKSIKISGGSLSRTVDVVPANWYDTNSYASQANEVLRGIHILDAQTKTRESDQPFLHVALIDYKDTQTAGNLRRLVRLFKSVKYDSDSPRTMSSFDIEGIVYALDAAQISGFASGQELQLALRGYQWLHQLDQDATLRGSLRVPDGKRLIFADGHATHEQLQSLKRDLASLLNEVQTGLAKTARRLSDARLQFPNRPPAMPFGWS